MFAAISSQTSKPIEQMSARCPQRTALCPLGGPQGSGWETGRIPQAGNRQRQNL